MVDSFERAPGLAGSTYLFVTGAVKALDEENLVKLETMAVQAIMRRMVVADLQLDSSSTAKVKRWYVCTGAGLRKTLLEWLKDCNVVFETFNF